MTTNEIIYKTLRTKVNKEPKYMDVLADIGIEIYDSNASSQGFWSVRYIPTGKMLVISKGYDKKNHLYTGRGFCKTNAKDLSKFDYIGFLRCDRNKYHKPDPCINTEYKELRRTIYECKRDYAWAKRDLDGIDKQIASLMKEKEWHEKRVADATNGLETAMKRIAELKRGREN